MTNTVTNHDSAYAALLYSKIAAIFALELLIFILFVVLFMFYYLSFINLLSDLFENV